MRMRSVLAMVLWGLVVGPSQVWSQEVLTDQVSITSARGQLFGITSREGIARQVLASGEEVLVVEAKGLTGYVLTTRRLLGFSGRLQRWVEMNLSSSEQVVTSTVTPRMIIVQGRDSVYGFQSDLGRWKRDSWGAGETLVESVIDENVGVVITNRRALGFSALTGGFFSQDLPSDNSIQRLEVNDNIVIIHLSGLMLVFRSGLAIWAVLP
jgi:hypothetical protein